MTLLDVINQGIRYHNAGQLDQAEHLYLRVLQQSPNNPDALHLLGVLYQQRGQLGVSIEMIARAIAAKPDASLFHSNLAEALRRLNLLEEAEAAVRRAVTIDPTLAAGHANLGVILHAQHRNDDAEVALRRALELDPNKGQAMVALCSVLKEQGRLDEAIEVGQRAVTRFSDQPAAHNNYAAVLEVKGSLAQAEAAYRKAIQLDPRFFAAMDNLGTILYRQGDLKSAMTWWDKALSIAPDYAGALWNRAIATLAMGDFERGWEMFEMRLTSGPSRMYYREYPGIPPWTGFDLRGKSILLFPEQGYGDVIQYARFIPVLAEMGAKVILHMPSEMIELMKRVPGVWRIVGPDEDLPKFDTYRALMSLPMVLKTTLKTVPNQVPYIQLDPQRDAQWKQRLAPYAGTRKVGIAWAGRPTHRDDARRSMALSRFAPLADVPGITLFSLQKGDAAAQLRDAPFGSRIIDLQDQLPDFADTAAAIANLDLVIAVDTAVVHLAGALAKPVWALLATAGDYRWMLDREDSPWYPTMRLFRQKNRDDWDPVISRVRDELAKQ
jgi:tetratricopeptide (TPR) repeat protein